MRPHGVIAVLLSVIIPGQSIAANLPTRVVTLVHSTTRPSSAAHPETADTHRTVLFDANLIGPPLPSAIIPTAPTSPAALDAVALTPDAKTVAALPAGVASDAPGSQEQRLRHEIIAPKTPLDFSSDAENGLSAEAHSQWTERIADMFDGKRAFLVRHGEPAVEIPVQEAPEHGRPVRILTAKGDPSMSHEDTEAIEGLVTASGVRNVSIDNLYVDWSPQAPPPAHLEQTKKKAPTLSAVLTWPFREAAFLAKNFTASLVKPLPSEIIGGLMTKSYPLLTSITVYFSQIGFSHPWALTGLITLSVVQEVFHGAFLKSWNNFQDFLNRERGFNYQMFFNLAYMQGFGTLYRLMSWTANPETVTPPWSTQYWVDVALMSVIGTFFGVLGFNSLNTLYAKGVIKRWQHSGIQQLRDLFFLLAGPFFATGQMKLFWGIFFVQQALELAIALWAGYAKTKSIHLITSAAVAESPEFKKKYSINEVTLSSPLKQAWDAVVDNALVRLMTWPARALVSLLMSGGRK